jgi:thiamine biosynthesis protein ThiC
MTSPARRSPIFSNGVDSTFDFAGGYVDIISQIIAAVHFLTIHQGVTLESTQHTAENRRGTGLARNVYTSVARR